MARVAMAKLVKVQRCPATVIQKLESQDDILKSIPNLEVRFLESISIMMTIVCLEADYFFSEEE